MCGEGISPNDELARNGVTPMYVSSTNSRWCFCHSLLLAACVHGCLPGARGERLWDPHTQDHKITPAVHTDNLHYITLQTH